MKTTLCFILTLLTFVMFAFVPNSFAQDNSPEYVVRVIYFLPNDREPDPNMDEKLDTLMKDAQQFYADQMEVHGFKRKTFRFEADDASNVIVHHVNGKFNDAYYLRPSIGLGTAWAEIEEQFDMHKNIYFLAYDISNAYLVDTTDGRTFYGIGIGDSLSGTATIPASNFRAAIHELGHAFGLRHDSNFGGNRIFTRLGDDDWMTNSFCAAEWLNVHRYFNPTQEAFNTDTKVKMLTPSLAAPPNDIRLKFEVTDPDGLHQVQLHKPYGAYPSVIDYQSLNGTRATVEFVTNELIDGNNITLRVIDKHGNFDSLGHSFRIEIIDLLSPMETVSIPDANLAARIHQDLRLTPDHTITQLDMLGLKVFSYIRRGDNPVIRDFTGLEYAKNLKSLHLQRNPIDDISPLEELTNLERLYLLANHISDISPLENLTNLEELHLYDNRISDISPLENLTKLKRLYLHNNSISDLSPLENLTNLEELSISNNPIRDHSPLKNLTKLKDLGGFRIRISDLSPLKNLTNLERLRLHNYEFEKSHPNRNQITDISPLKNLTKLKDLTLVDNQISDITPLAGLANLRYLNIYENKISDPSPIVGLTNLRRISLAKNQISDVSSLENLKITEVLNLNGNPIKDIQPLFTILRNNPGVAIWIKYRKKPLPVTLSHFQAEHTDASIVLKWTTESEVDNAGFYIYRSETKDGTFKVVNPTMIRGAGTTGERNEYTWTDTTAKPNVAYYYYSLDSLKFFRDKKQKRGYPFSIYILFLKG